MVLCPLESSRKADALAVVDGPEERHGDGRFSTSKHVKRSNPTIKERHNDDALTARPSILSAAILRQKNGTVTPEFARPSMFSAIILQQKIA